MVPVGRRKTSDKGDRGERGDAPEGGEETRPRFSRRAHLLMLTLAAELLLIGGIHAAGQWSKARGIAVPVTETDKTMIT